MHKLRVRKHSILIIRKETSCTVLRCLFIRDTVVYVWLVVCMNIAKELCETLNLKAIMFGGRIPNYHKYADKMRPKEYIARVRQREIYDPVLTFQLSNDFHVRKVMTNYLPNDEESKHYACLLQWDNIYYQPPTQEYINPKTTVRVGLVQWQMRSYKTLDDLFEQVEFL